LNKHQEVLNLVYELKNSNIESPSQISFKKINFKNIPKEVVELNIELNEQSGVLYLYSMDSDNNEVLSGPKGDIGKISASKIKELYKFKNEALLATYVIKEILLAIKNENIKVNVPITFQYHDSDTIYDIS